MHSNFFLYLTAISAVSLHNIVNEITHNIDNNSINLKTTDTNWTLQEINQNTKIFATCNGSRQSPINVETKIAKLNPSLRLGLTAYDKPVLALLINKFPTFQIHPISLRWPRPSALVSSSVARAFNPLADKYFALSHIQFHWSHQDNADLQANSRPELRSSVHSIDNLDHPMEIHFVHLNTAYASIEEALSKPDGLLILAVMTTASSHESYLFDRILDELTNLTNTGQQSIIEEESTWRSFLPSDTSHFYRYQGSMIYPPCYESVDWIIFDEKLRLGRRQLRRLRRFKFNSYDLRTNKEIDWSIQRRPIQALNNRTIECSFLPKNKLSTIYNITTSSTTIKSF